MAGFWVEVAGPVSVWFGVNLESPTAQVAARQVSTDCLRRVPKSAVRTVTVWAASSGARCRPAAAPLLTIRPMEKKNKKKGR
ncbi:hypothetical protein ACPC54_18570 [Kitasatospora sp. NPDC094028]